MNQFGPVLAQSLIQNVGGNAARSELDKLSDPLKKLVFQNANARQWLEAALNDSSFPSDKVSLEDRALFLKKITRLVLHFVFPVPGFAQEPGSIS